MQDSRITRTILFSALLAFAVFILVPQSVAQFSNPAASASSIPESQWVQPAAMSKLLKAAGTDRPLMLQVGSHVMFAQAHIPDSVYAGPGSQPAGLQMLEKKTASTPKDKLIVIYCGCCPWGRCPNVGPAFKRLHDLGFTNVKVLYIANNFGDDWVAHGYQTEKGE
jgi:thiosulfate/3-mercaptopyruvate sulfurtransferase